MLRHPNVLLFAADDQETAALQEILSDHVDVTPVHDQAQLTSMLAADTYDALFCSWSAPTGTWSDVLRETLEISPDLPVIVLSNEVEERAWLRTLNAGAFDLLVAPFEFHQLLGVLEQASASREARALRHTPLRVRERYAC